jgi:hypothetical protein
MTDREKPQQLNATMPTSQHYSFLQQRIRKFQERSAQKLGAASDGVMFLEVTKVGKFGEAMLVNISRKLRVSLIRMLLCICYIVTFRISEGIETLVNEQHMNDLFTSNFEIKPQQDLGIWNHLGVVVNWLLGAYRKLL